LLRYGYVVGAGERVHGWLAGRKQDRIVLRQPRLFADRPRKSSGEWQQRQFQHDTTSDNHACATTRL